MNLRDSKIAFSLAIYPNYQIEFLILLNLPVNNSLVFGQPEDPGRLVARLLLRRHRPDLHEAKADVLHPAHGLAVLVEAGRHSHRIGEGNTECG